MKKMLTLCLFAVSLYAQAQTVTIEPATLQPDWITTYSDNGMGYLSKDGGVILEPVYEELHAFDVVKPGFAVIVQNGLSGLIDANGTIIAEPAYDAIANADAFNPNWLIVSIGGRYGFIDLEGNEVTPIVYDEFIAPQEETATLSPEIIKFHSVKNVTRN